MSSWAFSADHAVRVKLSGGLMKARGPGDPNRTGFLEHLDELRVRLIRAVMPVTVAVGICGSRSAEILRFIMLTWALVALGLLSAPQLASGGDAMGPRPTAAEEAVAIRAMLDQWGKDMAARGAEGFVAHFTDDGVLMPPKEPPVAGKEALAAWLSLYLELHASQPESAEIDELEASGDLAFVRYHTKGSYLVRATGKAVPYDRKVLDVLRRQPDGSWKVARHTWSSNNHLPSVWDDDWKKVGTPAVSSAGSEAQGATPGGDIVRDLFPAEQEAVAEVVTQVLDAAEKKDLDRLESFHLYGPKFTKFDDWPPLERQDAANSRRAERAALLALEAFTPSVEELRVDVFGSVAIATFILGYSVETEDTSVSTKARSTMVFVNDGADWKIVHEHHSAFKPDP